jgi:hypothetical protein
MGPLRAVKNGITGYADFDGRATRSEFWWWQLMMLLCVAAAGGWNQIFFVPAMLMLIPNFALIVRRLRDANMTTWWLMIALIPIVGGMILALILAFPGTDDEEADENTPHPCEGSDLDTQQAKSSDTIADSVDDRQIQGCKKIDGEAAECSLKPGDVVFLVHGTFASNATWIEPEGSFAIAMRNEVPDLRIEPFRWSGNNSPSARMQAGKELSERGEQLFLQGHRRFWIIGHSHGGNVALYDLALEKRIRY